MKFWISLHRPLQSITVRLAATMLLVALVPLTGLALYNLFTSENLVEEAELEKLQLLAQSTANRLDQLLVDTQRTNIILSQDKEVHQYVLTADPQQQERYKASILQLFRGVISANPDYGKISLLDARGRVLVSSDRQALAHDLGFRKYFQQALQGKTYVSPLLKSTIGNFWAVVFAAPVRHQGKVIGVMVLSLKREAIWNSIRVSNTRNELLHWLVDTNGIIVARSDNRYFYYSLVPLSPTAAAEVLPKESSKDLTHIPSLNWPEGARTLTRATQPGFAVMRAPPTNILRAIGFAPLRIQPWVVAVDEPVQDYQVLFDALAWQNYLTLFIVSGGTVVLGLWLARSITRPLRSLSKAAQALEKNCFTPDLLQREASQQDDMGELTRVFLGMAEQVKQREAQLQQQVIKLKIEIDQEKRARQVAEITESDYFQQLRQKAKTLRQRTPSSRPFTQSGP